MHWRVSVIFYIDHVDISSVLNQHFCNLLLAFWNSMKRSQWSFSQEMKCPKFEINSKKCIPLTSATCNGVFDWFFRTFTFATFWSSNSKTFSWLNRSTFASFKNGFLCEFETFIVEQQYSEKPKKLINIFFAKQIQQNNSMQIITVWEVWGSYYELS